VCLPGDCQFEIDFQLASSEADITGYTTAALARTTRDSSGAMATVTGDGVMVVIVVMMVIVMMLVVDL
jgi:hypothetical protein